MMHWAARKVMEAALQSCYMGVRSWGTGFALPESAGELGCDRTAHRIRRCWLNAALGCPP